MSKSPCQKEKEFIEAIYTSNKPIVYLCTGLLNKILTILHETFNISPEVFLKDNPSEPGNLGIHKPVHTFDYILKEGNIREKITAIGNVIWSEKGKHMIFMHILNYSGNNGFIRHRKKDIYDLLNVQTHANIDDINLSKKHLFNLAQPLPIIDKYYAYKRSITEYNKSVECYVKEDELIIPLSEKEIEYLKLNGYKGDSLPYKTGECIYKKSLPKNTRSMRRKKDNICAIASVSGYTLYFLDLCSLLGLNDLDKYIMLICMLFVNVPIHHSIMEIFDAAYIFGLLEKERKDPEKLVEDLIHTIVQSQNGARTGGGKLRKTMRRNSKRFI